MLFIVMTYDFIRNLSSSGRSTSADLKDEVRSPFAFRAA
jgi:hypothetical protein